MALATTPFLSEGKDMYQQMIERADAELALLDSEEHELSARLQVIQAGRDTLQAKASARQLQLTTGTQNVAQLVATFDQAKAAAKIAESTSAYASASAPLKDLEKQVKAALKAAQEIAARVNAEQDEDEKRSATLQAEREAATARLEEIGRERVALHSAKAKAFEDRGEVEYRAIVALIESYQQEIAPKEQELAAATRTLRSAKEEARARLEAWPHLLQQAKREMGLVDDPTVRVLKGLLDFLRVLETDGVGLVRNVGRYSPLLEMALSQGELTRMCAHIGDTEQAHQAVQYKQAILRELLRIYIAQV